MGREIRLISPSYVKAFGKRGKSDALDAEAICEAVQRPMLERRSIRTPMANWIRKLSEKKLFRLVSVALASKLARIVWVVSTRKEAYHPYAHLI